MLRCKKCNITYEKGKFCQKCGELLIKKETFMGFFVKFGIPLLIVGFIVGGVVGLLMAVLVISILWRRLLGPHSKIAQNEESSQSRQNG